MQQQSTPYASTEGSLRAKDVAKLLGIGKSTWDKWVSSKIVEPGTKLSHRIRIWKKSYIVNLNEKIHSGEFSTAGLYAKKEVGE